MREDATFLKAVLDSLESPVLVADAVTHEIVYMNRAAIDHHDEGAALIGRSLLECHNERSRRIILEVLAALEAGEDERIITDNEKHRIYMRGVRGPDGRVVAYYERYAPPEK